MAAGDLVTLEEAKVWLQIDDTSRDALITRLISSSSLLVQRHCGRHFPLGSRVETRDGHGGQAMVLKNWPVIAVASVVVNGLAIAAAIGQGGGFYWTSDEQGGATVYLRGYGFDRGQANVVLSYTAGYAVIPEDLQQAVLLTVQSQLGSQDIDPNLAGEAIPGTWSGTYRSTGIGSIPDSAKQLLDAGGWRRPFPV